MSEIAHEELTVPAELGQLDNVFGFISRILTDNGFSAGDDAVVQMAVEEIFSNIANYAYGSGKGEATVRVSIEGEPKQAVITFVDCGVPYNPLEKGDPDIMLPLEERQIGGLGIYMVKESMDHVSYKYENGSNVLTIMKKSNKNA